MAGSLSHCRSDNSHSKQIARRFLDGNVCVCTYVVDINISGKKKTRAGSDPQATLVRGPTTWKDKQRNASKDTVN